MAIQLMPGSGRPRGAPPRRSGMPSLPKRVAFLFRDAGKAWSADDASTHAAALSFYTLFSVSPLLVVVIAVAGLLYGQDTAAQESMARLRSIMGPQAAEAVKTILDHAGSKGTGVAATALGLLGVLLGASGVFGHLQGALNRMWRVRHGDGRGIQGLLRDRLLSFSLVVFMGFLLIASLAATTAISAMGETLSAYLPFSSAALQAINFGISLAATTLLFAVLFKFLPDGKVRWRDLWVGALATALLFSIGRFLIGFYLARGSVSSPYGAAGSLVVLMLWIYYSSQVLFFGAEFTRVFSERFGKGVEPRRGARRIGTDGNPAK
jgi:membrane protein